MHAVPIPTTKEIVTAREAIRSSWSEPRRAARRLRAATRQRKLAQQLLDRPAPKGVGDFKLQFCGCVLHKSSQGSAKLKFEAPDPRATVTNDRKTCSA
jgi:hypothetical protein